MSDRELLQQLRDALPVVPDGDVTVPVYIWCPHAGKSVTTHHAYKDDVLVKAMSHWRYAEETPQPPKDAK